MPDDLERRLTDSWDDNAAAWTAAVREGRIASRRAATDAAAVEAVRHAAPAGSTVLDVGCGEGWLAHALAAEGFAVTGFDGSATLIEAARVAGEGTFFVADYDAAVTDATLAPGPFDVAVCNFALLGEDLAPLLSALGQRLEPGGRLVIQTVHPLGAGAPYRDGWREETFAGFGDDAWAPMPWYFRTFSGWVRLLHDTGFALAEVAEPVHPETGAPLSLILTAAPS